MWCHFTSFFQALYPFNKYQNMNFYFPALTEKIIFQLLKRVLILKNNKKEKLAVVQYGRVYCIEDSSDYNSNYIFGRSSGSDYKKKCSKQNSD